MSTAPRPGPIVVGVDGSTDSEHALTWAAEQAHLQDRELVVVCALGSDEVPRERFGVEHDALRRALETMAGETVRSAVARVRAAYPEVGVRDEIPPLDPRVALLQLSEGAELVVVGSHGRGPVSRLMLGSVSLAVSQHAQCPVVVVRPRSGHTGHGILVGIDDTARARAAVEFGFRMASLRHQPLTVLHCFFDGRPAGPVGPDERGLEDERLVLGEAVAGLQDDHPDVAVQLMLYRGLADECLITAAQHRALVVVTAHPTHPLRGLLSPNVDKLVVEHAPSAVAVVPGVS